MKKIEHYFRFDLYGDNWSEITQQGKYVFYDPNYEISVNTNHALPFIILHFVTEYNLLDLELILRLAGFSALLPEEMPYRDVEYINYSSYPGFIYDSLFDGCTTKEEAEKYIEEKLGDGIIEKYKESKKAQDARQRLKIAKMAEEYGLGVYDLKKGRSPHDEDSHNKGR